MKVWVWVLVGLALLAARASQASIVIHDGRLGIVAQETGAVLDSFGHVWFLNEVTASWDRAPIYDPPEPVQRIKFWGHSAFITADGGAYGFYTQDQVWRYLGSWPGLSDIEPIADAAPKSMVIPNPSPGPCRASFRVTSEGPVTVEVIDVSGRVIRRLLEGPHPAGDYSVIWDARDDGGRDVPSGTYWTRITTGDGTTSGSIVLAK